MSGSTDPARDSSLRDRKAPGVCIQQTPQPRPDNVMRGRASYHRRHSGAERSEEPGIHNTGGAHLTNRGYGFRARVLCTRPGTTLPNADVFAAALIETARDALDPLGGGIERVGNGGLH